MSQSLIAWTVLALAAEPTLVERPDAYPTLVNPQCSHCRDEAKRRAAELRDDDRVLCWIRGYSDGGAIPLRFFLSPYRVISDTYGVFVFDPDAGFARGFAPSLDFRFHGWRNGVMAMKHKDGTLYSCLSGVAFAGPKKGERLKPVPTLVSDWGYWLQRYPQNVAYHMFEKYKPVELPTKSEEDSRKSRGSADARLPSDTAMLGVWDGESARAYPLAAVAKAGLVIEKDRVVLWHGPTKTAAAYRLFASPSKGDAKARALTLMRDDKDGNAPFVDKETGSRWDVAGRAVAGELAGWTLEWLDGVQVKWFAWAAEYPRTTIFEATAAPAPAAPPVDKAKEIAGTAEFLRAVPKHFARLEAVDVAHRRVTLLVEGEKLAKVWPLVPDAEVKVAGWWGRLDQFKVGDRVWAWFQLDRRKQAAAILMLTDEPTERDMHGQELPQIDAMRRQQRQILANRWEKEGLPATVSLLHPLSGEMELLLDHEAMRWGRSLKAGVELSLSADPPIRGVVKHVKPWRERTQVRLVVHGLDQTDLHLGGRIHLKMPTPPAEVLESPLPPDVAVARPRDERIEWFLASIYCTCPVGDNTCTGHCYTLASCNPNGCGAPAATRKKVAKLIDEGQTDAQIFELLLKERGPTMLRPHLAP